MLARTAADWHSKSRCWPARQLTAVGDSLRCVGAGPTHWLILPLNGRYPKTQSANDRFGVSKPNSFLWPGHDDRHEYGPSCKQVPAPRNGRPADVRYLVLISMVAMTAKGTMRASTNARAPEPSFSFSGPPKAASGVGPVWLHCSHRTTT